MAARKNKTNQKQDHLVGFLRSLPATGPDGFEGLIRSLLERWTGLTFRLARSGSQFGKDGTAETHGQFSVTFETKRYLETTGLSARELSGELLQVKTTFPDLDIWVLAATKEVGDLAEDLRKSAELLNLDILIVDARVDGFGPLQVLCAEHPDVVIDFMKRNNFLDEKQIVSHIDRIKIHLSYPSAVVRLRSSLTSTLFGTASARTGSYHWLKRHVENKNQAYSVFSQDLGLLEMGSRRILRNSLNERFDSWLTNWNTAASVCALLGEEGTGKTWALFSWLIDRFNESNGPIILPVTSAQLPATANLLDLMSTALSQRCGKTKDSWRKRLEAWLDQPKHEEPLIILCLDGLNERPDFPWRPILAQAASEKFFGRIAIVVSSRPRIWKKHVSTGIKETIVETDGYSDDELQLALASSGITLPQIPLALRPLIRKPRYCDLVVHHFSSLVSSGEMTIERLFYEDGKDKEKRKLNQPVSDEDFRTILCGLAKQYIDGITSFPKNNLNQFLPSVNSSGAMLQEIIDGGLLVPSGNITTPFKVDPRRLIHGLGMLLADHVKSKTESSVDYLVDVVRAWLEPQPDMDMKSSVVGAAVFFSIIDSNYKAASRRALLYAWVSTRNLPDEQEQNIYAYLPECAEDMTNIADLFWRSRGDNGTAHTRLAKAFLIRRDDERVKSVLVQAANRWMSYVNINGNRFALGVDDKKQQEISEAITEQFGRQLTPGENAKFLDWSFPITNDDGLLRLARFALLIISGGDRVSFVEAFIRWAISRRLMGRDSEFDAAAWTLRLTDEDLWPHFEAALLCMIESENETLKRAAHLLLGCLGGNQAYTLRSERLSGLYPPAWWQVESEKDPLASDFGQISKDQCLPCMQRSDLTLHKIERKIDRFFLDPSLDEPKEFVDRLIAMANVLPVQSFHAKFSHTIEDHQIQESVPLLARFAWQTHNDLMRRVIRTLPTRDEEGKRQLLLHLPEISMVMRDEEVSVLESSLKEYWAKSQLWTEYESDTIMDREVLAEAEGFLAMSMKFSPEKVAEAILSRPKNAFDLRQLQHWFDLLPEEIVCSFQDRLLIEVDEKVLSRLIWILSSSKPKLSPQLREKLKGFLESNDDTLKGSTYRYIFATNDLELIEYVLLQKTALLSTEKSWADTWHFEILCRFGDEISLSDWVDLLSLSDLGAIVFERGCRSDEISVFVSLFNGVWQRTAIKNGYVDTAFPALQITFSEDYGVRFIERKQRNENTTRTYVSPDASWGNGSNPAADNLKELFGQESDEQFVARQREFRNKIEMLSKRDETSLWSIQFPVDLLKPICRDYPDMIKEWVEAAKKHKGIFVSCEGFYQSLANALVDIDPVLGFELWDYIRKESSNICIRVGPSGSTLMMHIPFSAAPSTSTETAREVLLDECMSDVDLFELATVATASNCTSWLLIRIQTMLAAQNLWRRAKGLMLASLSDLDIDFDQMINDAKISNSWVDELVGSFKKNHSRNKFARFWYKKFITVDCDDEAFSAYILFLKCADRRCQLWMNETDTDTEIQDVLKPKRVKYRLTNYQQIDRAIKENEKDLKDHFLTLKTYKGQLVPFI